MPAANSPDPDRFDTVMEDMRTCTGSTERPASVNLTLTLTNSG